MPELIFYTLSPDELKYFNQPIVGEVEVIGCYEYAHAEAMKRTPDDVIVLGVFGTQQWNSLNFTKKLALAHCCTQVSIISH